MRKSVSSAWSVIALFAICLAGPAVAATSAPTLEIIRPSQEWVRYPSDTEILFLEYNARKPPEIRVRDTSGSGTLGCEIDQAPCDPRRPITLSIKPGEHKDFGKTLTLSKGAEKWTYHIQLSPLRPFELTGESKLDRDILLSPYGAIVILSPKGDLLYYRRIKPAAEDFKRHWVDGKTYYSYLRTRYGIPGLTVIGTRVLMNADFEVIREFPWDADEHDFLMLGADHFVHTEYKVRDVSKSRCMIDQRLVETRNGRDTVVLSTVDLLKQHYFPTSFERRDFRGRTCINFDHVNSVQAMTPDHWLIGMGSFAILYDIRAHKPLWSFGGVMDDYNVMRLPKLQELMGLIHTPTWDPAHHKLTFYANYMPGANGAPASGIVEVKLDEKHRSIVSFSRLPVGEFFTPHSGGFVEDGSILTACTGVRERGDFDVMEYEEGEAQPHFKIRFLAPTPPYLYRVYR